MNKLWKTMKNQWKSNEKLLKTNEKLKKNYEKKHGKLWKTLKIYEKPMKNCETKINYEN